MAKLSAISSTVLQYSPHNLRSTRVYGVGCGVSADIGHLSPASYFHDGPLAERGARNKPAAERLPSIRPRTSARAFCYFARVSSSTPPEIAPESDGGDVRS